MRPTFHRLLVALLALPSLGCGWFGGDEAAEADATEADVLAIAGTQPVQVQPDQPEERLELKLAQGDRFPLVKTVEQTLSQVTPAGLVTSRNRLRLQMVIAVDQVHPDGRKTLGVKYHRVSYSHDVAGEQVAYDSAAPPPGPLPAAVQGYHGLVGNGFAFELGPDNRIRDVIGFKGFLEQCLRDVPPTRRNVVLVELEATQGEEGIANFVDDSIGLLPYDASRTGRESVVRPGHQWQRSRQIARPVPLFENTTYTLRSIDDRVAEIDVIGSISQSATFGPSGQPNENMLVVVKSGNVFGTCTIRRDSGLPIKSRVERFFDMLVRTSDGNVFDQKKHVLTTIETYEEQSNGTAPVIVPASAEAPAANSVGSTEQPVVPADFTTP